MPCNIQNNPADRYYYLIFSEAEEIKESKLMQLIREREGRDQNYVCLTALSH